ncbi:acyl carrier protein [Enterococcus faecium]|uniref:Acyl carrier protein n=2 Tax=Enterococcus TaxID=1350 RepID=A0AAJ1SM41_9ENTE|nr:MULTISPECIES: acyl carrier protein [Enterococcus]MDP8584421.1 acyl carrier protein [Listeria innocua]EGP4984162.1 acyl carrier protein [Enterococcus faecium]EGP5086515.1 acyl carrier protein [Enterococcus faecium]EGP5122397.1 acyl carrier protein [Enterococcus faecium]EGP5140838.1 acyl carrier protein [Enterococcus faecium]
MYKYKKIFIENLQLPEGFEEFSSLTIENTSNWDSLAQITLISDIETEFDIELETEDILLLNSFNAGIEILKEKGVYIE